MSKGLGRGLDALFNMNELKVENKSQDKEFLKIDEIRPNPYQPRKKFDEAALLELASSIKQHGLIQPLIVRKSIYGYEIAAGERRLRAAKLAGLKEVPVIINNLDDNKMMEIALIENLQREDLNPIEIATAYKKLMLHLSLTQEDLAQKVGKSRPQVANFLRLLNLPSKIQEEISSGRLSTGHAKALLTLKDSFLQEELALKVIKDGASVRQLEEWIKAITKKPRKKSNIMLSTQEKYYEDLLRKNLETNVKIKKSPNKLKLEITYSSQEDLEVIYKKLFKFS